MPRSEGGRIRDRISQAENRYKWYLPLGRCPRECAEALVRRLMESGIGSGKNRLSNEIERLALQECIAAWRQIDPGSAEWKRNVVILERRFETHYCEFREHVAARSDDEKMAFFLWHMLRFGKVVTMTIMRIDEERVTTLVLPVLLALKPGAAADVLVVAVR